jgi:hypothetical protein
MSRTRPPETDGLRQGETHWPILSDGDVYSFGYGRRGRLSLGDSTDRRTPTRTTTLSEGVTGVAAG